MNKNETIIRARGYEVTLPTSAVAAFLALSHDEQCDMADAFNRWDAARDQLDLGLDYNEIEASEDTQDTTDLLIESMAQELDTQDQAIDAHMDEIARLRSERNAVIATGNAVHAMNRELSAENDNLTDVLVQTARYVGQCRELLAAIGIEIKTDPSDGEPVLLIATA